MSHRDLSRYDTLYCCKCPRGVNNPFDTNIVNPFYLSRVRSGQNNNNAYQDTVNKKQIKLTLWTSIYVTNKLTLIEHSSKKLLAKSSEPPGIVQPHLRQQGQVCAGLIAKAPKPARVYLTWWGRHSWGQKPSKRRGAAASSCSESLETVEWTLWLNNDLFALYNRLVITWPGSRAESPSREPWIHWLVTSHPASLASSSVNSTSVCGQRFVHLMSLFLLFFLFFIAISHTLSLAG